MDSMQSANASSNCKILLDNLSQSEVCANLIKGDAETQSLLRSVVKSCIKVEDNYISDVLEANKLGQKRFSRRETTSFERSCYEFLRSYS